MTQLEESRRFKVYFYGAITALAWLAALSWNGLVGEAAWIPALKLLGIATAVATLVSVAVDRWFWRWLPGVPDLSGRWEGWYWNNMGRSWLPTAYQITQHRFHLTCHAWGPDGWSRPQCSAIFGDGGVTELISNYELTPHGHQAAPHRGTEMLRLETDGRDKFLIGRYHTDRARVYRGAPVDPQDFGQGGYIRLRRVSSKPKSGLHFKENGGWGMPKPDRDP